MGMFVILKEFGRGLLSIRVAPAMVLVVFAASVAIFAAAQAEKTAADHPSGNQVVDHFYDPLPQETGANGLKLMLRRLQTTGRLMQTTAHPDDEDGGMLTLEARGKGVSTLLMTLNRGEGGQNKLGSNLFDALGVLRTLELLAADRYYGVEQRFSRVADFGYSKTAEETFQKWQGHDIALSDMVRVIRTFRPDVLVARFSGTERDGHGHHQASAILTREAFRAAADPKRFPEQIAAGLQPWQPKKLYIGNVCGFGAKTCDAANYTVKLNTGTVDPLLGASYIQFAMLGLRHQKSQGAANWTSNRAIASRSTSWLIRSWSLLKTKTVTNKVSSMAATRPCRDWPIDWEPKRKKCRGCGRRWLRSRQKLPTLRRRPTKIPPLQRRLSATPMEWPFGLSTIS